MIAQLMRLLSDEEAPTAVEYALLVATVAMAIVGGAYVLGQTTSEHFNETATKVENPPAPSH